MQAQINGPHTARKDQLNKVFLPDPLSNFLPINRRAIKKPVAGLADIYLNHVSMFPVLSVFFWFIRLNFTDKSNCSCRR